MSHEQILFFLGILDGIARATPGLRRWLQHVSVLRQSVFESRDLAADEIQRLNDDLFAASNRLQAAADRFESD